MPTVVASRSVPRPRKPLQKGRRHHLHIVLRAELLQLVDRAAEELAREKNPWAPPLTLTETIETLLTEALRKRGILK